MSGGTPRDAGDVVIVGGGLAGFSAATRLRALGHEGGITIVDAEPAVYDRPPLSKELFAEDFGLERLAFASARELAEARIATLLGTRAVDLDPVEARVRLDTGESLHADTVLIATGGRARVLPIPGADGEGVLSLRTYADAVAIRDRAHRGSTAVVVGAGLIGAELASSLRSRGVAVTLVDPVEVPLVPAVGERMARHLHGMHAERGIAVVVGVCERIDRLDGRLSVVVDGRAFDADLVVVGVGIVPNSEIAERAGLHVDDGVIVDERMRTSADRVFAAGDVARRRQPDGVLARREEHWEAAQSSGAAAASCILGLDAPERGAGWFWSDRHGIHLEAVGRLSGPGEVVIREGAQHPAVFLIEDGQLAGAATVDDANTVRAARRLIDQRIPVSAAELADPAVPLRALLKASRDAESGMRA